MTKFPFKKKDMPQPHRATEEIFVDKYTKVRRVTHEHVLDTYSRRSQINDRQLEAGLVFRRHWERGMSQRITAPPDGANATSARGASRRDISESQLASRDQVRRLLKVQAGPLEGRILIRVAGCGEWAGRAAGQRGLDRRAIDMLRSALTAVANELGMP
jgi:hypothetical protein